MSTAMTCERCGLAMNRHAQKLREPRTDEEARLAAATDFVVLEEHHVCPECGTSATRLVPFPGSA